MSASAPFPRRTRIRLWDLPVRISHWSLVLAVSTAVVTGELGGSWMSLHGKAGLAIVGLVVFRLVWGLIGSTHARFVRFAPTPGKLKAYLRGRWTGVGHNPLGALSVFALLALLAAQAGSGLFSNDDIAFSGPLFGLVDEALASRLTGLHKQLANALLALLALHVTAIAFYVGLKKDKLVEPMLTGWKDVEAGGESTQHGGPLAFVVALAIALAAVVAVSGAVQPATQPAAAAAAASPKPAW
jgi:cytochrome b